MPLLDRSAMAGSITSRVDHQDAVAVYLALSMLAGDAKFGVKIDTADGAVIHCEGNDDLELVTPEERCLISVKAQSGDLGLVVEEYSRLSKRSNADPRRRGSMALVMIGPQPVQLVTFAQQLLECKSLIIHRDAGERDGIYTEFGRRWPRANRQLVEQFHVLLETPRLHSDEYMAVAVRLLRRIAPLTNYTDERAIVLVVDITRKFAKARLLRSSVTLTEVQDAIVSFAVPAETVSVVQDYVRTEYGYLKHPTLTRLMEEEASETRFVIRRAMRRYRRVTRRFRAKSFLFGPIRCISCDGPLAANFFGSTRNGIACSHCGFQPYMSLLYACICGWPVLLVTNPPLDLVDMTISIRDALETAVCDKCHQRPKVERFFSRVFQLNVPWPPEEFSEKHLIDARKAYGWTERGFRDGIKASPDLLMAEALADRTIGRLPSDSAENDGQV